MKSLYPYLLSLFTLLVPLAARSQTETITKNPKAVRLREIWGVRGHEPDERVGNGVGGGFDVNNDGLGDFAVRFGGEWRVFYGDSVRLNDTVRWRFHATGASPDWFFTGNFYGTGHRAIGVTRDSCHPVTSQCSLRVHIFRTDDGYLPDTPATIIDTKLQFCLRGWQAADLDGDGADELILTRLCDDVPLPELWIYRGGADFQGDEPTVKIVDVDGPLAINQFSASVGDFDGDGALDIATAGQYKDHVKLKFYWGSKEEPWNWNRPPRVIELRPGEHPCSVYFSAIDSDGDGIDEIWMSPWYGVVYMYRPNADGKSARTRSFRMDDADAVFYSQQPRPRAVMPLGYLNDSARRYQVVGILMTITDNVHELRVFSGGPHGPDSSYDAWHRDDIETIYSYGIPIDDCDGDGWPEVIFGQAFWYGSAAYGKAVILAGGLEIPRDFPTSGVRDLPLEDKQRAVSLWPNPVHDELNIAWRGDLRHMPARFEVYDLLGGLVATGSVEPWHGAALWHCDGVPAGTYILSIRDAGGMLLTTASIIKQ